VNDLGAPSVSPVMHLRPTLARAGVAAGSLVLVVGFAACGGDDSGTTSGGDATTTTAAGTDTASGANDYVVVAEDFSLTDLTVSPGEQITLDNRGGVTHTLTADDGSFDSGRVEPGQQSAPLTAPSTPGAYTYHCAIHASMAGTLTVQ